ncbi:MFS transporter [Sphingomonadaceae bacterium G21617-S1]|nr:MFS transporter [Sphingomonadaceae bacterium G21617-S1]
MADSIQPPSTRRILLASLTGTSVEFYDFYIFATAASLVFGPLFFGGFEPSTQLIWSYTLLGLAFLSRPLGAWAFGHFGDRIGRKSTLVASLMVMGMSTLLIAFLPSYETAGWIGALLLAVLRFGQGFGLGGEWGGAALLAVENAPPGWRGRYGMFPQLGAPVGFIAANGLFLILGVAMTQQQFMDWGWRLPFLGSALLVGVGLWVRLKLTETPAFQAAMAEAEPARVPIAELFRSHLVPTVAGTFAAVACFATYYLATAFALGYGTKTLGISKETFLGVQLVTILFMAAGILLAGWWSDVKSPRYVLICGCVGTIATGLMMGPMFLSGALPVISVWLALALFMMGFVYGPLGAFLPSLFPPRVRYTGASMTFNIAGILGAAPVPAVAQWLADRGGLGFVGYYLSASALVSLAALWWSRHHDRRAMVA